MTSQFDFDVCSNVSFRPPTDAPSIFTTGFPNTLTFADLAKSSTNFAFLKKGWFLLVSLVLHVMVRSVGTVSQKLFQIAQTAI